MMTTQFVAMKETDTVLDTVEVLRALDEDFRPFTSCMCSRKTPRSSLACFRCARWCWRIANHSSKTSCIPRSSLCRPMRMKKRLLPISRNMTWSRCLSLTNRDACLAWLLSTTPWEVMEESTESEKSTSRALTVVAGVIGGAAALAVYTLIVLEIAGVL